MKEIRFTLNHQEVTVVADPMARLIDVLREVLQRKETKEGCGIGECGACTVLINGHAVNSCITNMSQVEGCHVMTIEGLSEDAMADIIKKCFVEEGAVQCGFCTPGMILSAYVLLQKKEAPTVQEIKEGLSGNLCRCTGYTAIVNAVDRAATEYNLRKNEEAS